MDKDKALLIYAGWMGDFIWLVPTIRALGKKFELSLAVSEQQEGLAKSLAMEDGLEKKVVNHVFVDYKYKGLKRPMNWLRIAREAKRLGIGTYIDLVGKIKTQACIPISTKIDVYKPSDWDTNDPIALRMHQHSIKLPRREHYHRVDNFLDMLKFFGINDYEINFNLIYNKKTVEKAEEIIGKNRLKDGSVVLNIGAGQFSKIWPANRFLELAAKLKRDLEVEVVIMGANNFKWNQDYDRHTAQRIFEPNYEGPILVSNSDLLVNSYLLSSGIFNVSVGNDSFPNHIAGSASQVPPKTEGAVMVNEGRYAGRYFKAPTRTLTLMGSTNPLYCEVWDPTMSFHTFIRPDHIKLRGLCGGDKLCSYGDGSQETCPRYTRVPVVGSAPCMDAITVKTLYDGVRAQFNRT